MWEDARVWVHKNFHLEVSNYLKSRSASFPQSTGYLILISALNSFLEVLKVSDCSGY